MRGKPLLQLAGVAGRAITLGLLAALAGHPVLATEPAVGSQPTSVAASSPAAALAAAAPAGSAPHAEGRRVYNERCYFCHGYAGDAQTLAATYLNPPPLDFRSERARALDEATLVRRVTEGVPGTAMQGFGTLLGPDEIRSVSRFVLETMIRQRRENTRYHTAENGWTDHERYREAYPFALGRIALDTPWQQLDAAGQRGKRLYMSTCISCHDHGRVQDAGLAWESRPVTFPRDAYCTSCHEAPLGGRLRAGTRLAPDPVGAPYRLHDRPPAAAGLNRQQRRGAQVYQRNCAYCHAADGSAGSWIGQFLEPHPRKLTDPVVMAGMTRQRLRQTILDGLPGTSMPAWRSVLTGRDIDAVMAYIDRVFHPLRPD